MTLLHYYLSRIVYQKKALSNRFFLHISKKSSIFAGYLEPPTKIGKQSTDIQ
jgi:hypothetical protein